jgi:hypothetical protein
VNGVATLPCVLLGQATPGLVDPDAAPLLALRRWYTHLSLTSPVSAPSSHAIGAWLLGLLSLLMIAAVAQGPVKALGQFVDLPGHARLFRLAMRRFRRAGRPVALLLGTAVISWTISQFASYDKAERLDDLNVFRQSKTLAEMAFEQVTLVALSPLRDVAGLGDFLILLVAATVLVFKLSADRWGSSGVSHYADRQSLPPWTTLCWGATWLYAMYRFAGIVVDTAGLPLGGCVIVEAAVIPLLMLASDGLLLAWLLVELRNAGMGVPDDRIDVRGSVALVPAAMVACLGILPARYAVSGTWLLLQHAPAAGDFSAITSLIRGWGIVNLQAAAIVTMGMAGVVAWGSGRVLEVFRDYFGLLRVEGGRLAALIALGGLSAGAGAAAIHALVLSLPAQPWVLSAADSYAHYFTLPIGLIVLSALVELGSRALPEAEIVVVEETNP